MVEDEVSGQVLESGNAVARSWNYTIINKNNNKTTTKRHNQSFHFTLLLILIMRIV